jgi:hypothetical protein
MTHRYSPLSCSRQFPMQSIELVLHSGLSLMVYSTRTSAKLSVARRPPCLYLGWRLAGTLIRQIHNHWTLRLYIRELFRKHVRGHSRPFIWCSNPCASERRKCFGKTAVSRTSEFSMGKKHFSNNITPCSRRVEDVKNPIGYFYLSILIQFSSSL